MNLDDLQAVRENERAKDSLPQLREGFYSEVGDFLEEVRTRRDRAAEAAIDPFDDPDVRRLTDELKTAERTIEAIYERRVGKMVKLASFTAADIPTDIDGLTTEEQELFSSIVASIENNRDRVFSILSGESDAMENEISSDDSNGSVPRLHGGNTPGATDQDDTPGSPGAGPVTSTSSLASGDKSEAENDTAPTNSRRRGAGAATPSSGSSDTHETFERTTVKITRDIGEIMCIDERSYDLFVDDIVTLPVENAKPLVERNAAKLVE